MENHSQTIKNLKPERVILLLLPRSYCALIVLCLTDALTLIRQKSQMLVIIMTRMMVMRMMISIMRIVNIMRMETMMSLMMSMLVMLMLMLMLTSMMLLMNMMNTMSMLKLMRFTLKHSAASHSEQSQSYLQAPRSCDPY